MDGVTKGRIIMNHPAYMGHPLERVDADDRDNFGNCEGCMEPCAGTRYELSDNGRVLNFHICCAEMPVTQPKLNGFEFKAEIPAENNEGKMSSKAKIPAENSEGKKTGRCCSACNKAVNLFVYYHCSSSGVATYYHPCCANKTSCKCTRPTTVNSVNNHPAGRHRK